MSLARLYASSDEADLVGTVEASDSSSEELTEESDDDSKDESSPSSRIIQESHNAKLQDDVAGLKKRAYEAFRLEHYEDALTTYKEAITMLQTNTHSPSQGTHHKRMERLFFEALHSGARECALKLGRFQDAINHGEAAKLSEASTLKQSDSEGSPVRKIPVPSMKVQSPSASDEDDSLGSNSSEEEDEQSQSAEDSSASSPSLSEGDDEDVSDSESDLSEDVSDSESDLSHDSESDESVEGEDEGEESSAETDRSGGSTESEPGPEPDEETQDEDEAEHDPEAVDERYTRWETEHGLVDAVCKR